MGEILLTKCLSCKYEKRLFVGYSFHDSEKYMYPCYCKKCKKASTQNINKDKFCCSSCRGPVTFYGEIKLIEQTLLQSVLELLSKRDTEELIPEKLINNKVYKIDSSKYYCPSCKKIELKFHPNGCWD